MTTVSPSPRELIARLSDAEKIAVDLVLEVGEAASDADPRFAALVPDDERRGYLKTLATQLRSLGITVFDNATLDERLGIEQAQAEEWAARLREDCARAAEQRRSEAARLEALPPDVRRAVERRRRRERRRGAR